MQAHFYSCVSLVVRARLLVCFNIPSFRLSFAHFFIALRFHFNIPHPTIPYFSWCQCDHTIDDLGIHLLRCLCGKEHITAHDMFLDTIVAIISKNGAHIQKEVSHLFPTTHKDEWILSSLEMVFEPWQTLSLSIQLIEFFCNLFWRR